MAAAIGAGLPVTEPTGSMIVDIGGGTTDIAVVSLAGLVYGRSLRVAGGDMDDAIIQYVKRRHNLLIGEPTAERLKCEIGSAVPLDSPLRTEVKGRHLSVVGPFQFSRLDRSPRSVGLWSGMPKRISSRRKLDAVQNARRVVLESVGESDATDAKPTSLALVSQVMAEMGRKGGRIGGKRRLETMTSRRRSQVARNAAKARWAKKKNSAA